MMDEQKTFKQIRSGLDKLERETQQDKAKCYAIAAEVDQLNERVQYLETEVARAKDALKREHPLRMTVESLTSRKSDVNAQLREELNKTHDLLEQKIDESNKLQAEKETLKAQVTQLSEQAMKDKILIAQLEEKSKDVTEGAGTTKLIANLEKHGLLRPTKRSRAD
jgi:chromosome segregation ATPase